MNQGQPPPTGDRGEMLAALNGGLMLERQRTAVVTLDCRPDPAGGDDADGSCGGARARGGPRLMRPLDVAHETLYDPFQ